MVKKYTDADADLNILKNKTVAVIGYGNQGMAQAMNMRDSGVKVIIGLRKGKTAEAAERDGFKVLPISEATRTADIIHILIPDEAQKKVYEEDIKPNLTAGKVLGFSHAFNIHFKQVIPPNNVDVIMIAPKAPGKAVRREYLNNFGVPGLLAVAQDYSGTAKKIALAMAKAIGLTRVQVIETTFKEEVETDLFGEQVVLCGGLTELIKAGFDTLVEAGYQPEMAYYECLHEVKLIVDLIYAKGLKGMWEAVSNTAKYGGLTRGPRIINKQTREDMKKILKEIQSGQFSKEWIEEYQKGSRKLSELRAEEEKRLIEKIGAQLRREIGLE
ncbi:MAG: ketol-acid reductoisomerase [Candidatus Odinarchaeota archaeon]